MNISISSNVYVRIGSSRTKHCSVQGICDVPHADFTGTFTDKRTLCAESVLLEVSLNRLPIKT